MTTTLDNQRALLALGYNIGPAGADGREGEATRAGVARALSDLARLREKEVPPRVALTTSAAGRKAIAEREGNKLSAYQDSVGIWTVGVGHTSAAGSPPVHRGLTITAAESDAILSRDLAKFEAAVREAVTVSLTQNEFDALVSLAFNIGGGAFAKSTLVRKLNSGDRVGAADQFAVWNKAGGRVLAGLTTRRAAERKQFLTP